MTGTQQIQAIREAAPKNPEGVHANAIDRSSTTKQERIAKVARTLEMAEALYPEICKAYGQNRAEATDAANAMFRLEQKLMFLIAPNGGWP